MSDKPVVSVTPAATGQGFSASGALTQVGGALGAILLVIVAGAWVVRKLGLSPSGIPSQKLKVRASCTLGQRERVVVVEVEGTWLVLGVTPQQITALHTLPAPPAGANDAGNEHGSADFPTRLRQMLNRTGRDQ